MEKPKTWDRKLSDWLNQKAKGFSNFIYNPSRIQLGDRIINKKEYKNRIYIHLNKTDAKRTIFLAILICAFFSYYLVFKTGGTSWILLFITAIICVPLAVMILNQLNNIRRSRDPWIIDTKNKTIQMDKLVLKNSQIRCLCFSRLPDPEPDVFRADHDYTYQVILILSNGNEIVLLNGKGKDSAIEAGKFIGEKLELLVDERIRNA